VSLRHFAKHKGRYVSRHHSRGRFVAAVLVLHLAFFQASVA
jgi:hypothetical protein